jgi:hypothetical protein
MAQINNIKEPPIFDQTIKSFIYWKQCMESYIVLVFEILYKWSIYQD